MSEIIKTSLDGVKSFTDAENAIGEPILTASGVTVIPVSKVSFGFASGGLDFGQKKLISSQNFGGGGGTGLSITPIAFLTIDKNSRVELIHIANEKSTLEKAISAFESSPEIIKKIKDTFT